MDDTSSPTAPMRPRTPSPRRNDGVAMLPTGVGQPVGKKRRHLTFSMNEVEIDERRRRKRAAVASGDAGTERPAEAASSSSGSNGVQAHMPQSDNQEDAADGIFSGGESGANAEAEGGSTSSGAPCSNSPSHINADETTLAQLFEEGLDRAGEESDDDLI